MSSLVEAVRAGRVRVSTGPLVSIWADAPGWSATSSRDLHSVSGPLTVTVHVQAVDWVDVEEVRLVLNGVTIFRETVGASPVDRSWTFKLDPPMDAWMIAEAGHPLEDTERPEGSPYATIAPGHVPIGFTNPIWLDRDGDGRFSLTGGLGGRGPR